MAKTVVRQFNDEELNSLLNKIIQAYSDDVTKTIGELVTHKDLSSSNKTIQTAIEESANKLLQQQEKLFATKGEVDTNTVNIKKSIADVLKKLTTDLASKTDLNKTAAESLKQQEKLFATKGEVDANTGNIKKSIADATKTISDTISSTSKSSDHAILVGIEQSMNNIIETFLEKFVTMAEMEKKHDELKTEVGMILEANKGKLRSEFRTVVEANNEAIRAEFKGLLEANNKRLVQDIAGQIVDSLESIIERNLQKKVKETLANVKLQID